MPSAMDYQISLPDHIATLSNAQGINCWLVKAKPISGKHSEVQSATTERQLMVDEQQF